MKTGLTLKRAVHSIALPLALYGLSFDLQAHHGVASLGVAGLRGPGAPVESSTSATLPEGMGLGYFKTDYAHFERYTDRRDDEASSSTFTMFGAGYGMESWLSVYMFAPYHIKQTENNSYNTTGFADISLIGVLGFRYDGELRAIPETESLDDMEDWHFTIYGGGTVPTGDAGMRDSEGNIDPGMSTGFGSPSYTAGITATRMFGRMTVVNEASYISFDPYTYSDNNTVRFGSEFRYNLAFTYRAYVNKESKLRIDPVLEFNYVRIGMDREQGIRHTELLHAIAAVENIPLPSENLSGRFHDSLPPWRWTETMQSMQNESEVPAFTPWELYGSATGVTLEPSGGDIIYTLPGLRFFKDNISIAFGIKVPVWTNMNRIALTHNLMAAYLQGSYEGEPVAAVMDAWWQYGYHRERLLQGSEGREKYRAQFSLSFLL